jgi:hypothetical protein
MTLIVREATKDSFWLTYPSGAQQKYTLTSTGGYSLSDVNGSQTYYESKCLNPNSLASFHKRGLETKGLPVEVDTLPSREEW